jgi:hypothetical protein
MPTFWRNTMPPSSGLILLELFTILHSAKTQKNNNIILTNIKISDLRYYHSSSAYTWNTFILVMNDRKSEKLPCAYALRRVKSVTDGNERFSFSSCCSGVSYHKESITGLLAVERGG